MILCSMSMILILVLSVFIVARLFGLYFIILLLCISLLLAGVSGDFQQKDLETLLMLININ